MKKRLLVLALALMVSACHKRQVEVSAPAIPPATGPAAAAPPVSDEQDYQIYSAVINNQFQGKPLVVIELLTTPINGIGVSDEDAGRAKDYLFENLKLLTPELYGDFRGRNDQVYLLETKFSFNLEYKLIPRAEMDELFSNCGQGGWWPEFYRRYPNSSGIITFSRVGYSADGKTAMVYVGYGCGGLCGQGNDLILVLENGQWKIKEEVMIWIS
jgi:hypothetical protein